MPAIQPQALLDRWLFYAFLVLIMWLPLPLGSNRAWAWSIMEVWVFLLTITWLWQWYCGRATMTVALAAAKPVFLLLGFVVLWVGIQLIPLPISWVQWLSPMGAEVYAITSPGRLFVPLSLDPHATAVAVLKGLSYFLMFGLTLVLINSRQRLRWLAMTVVLSGVIQAVYGSLMTLSGLEYGFFIKKETYLQVATGTFINRNHLAGYLEMSLAVGIGLLLADLAGSRSVNWRQRTRSLVALLLSAKTQLRLALAIMVIALVLTHSRMGNAAFFISLTVTGLLGLLWVGRNKGSALVLVASLLVVDVFIVGAWFGVDRVIERIEQTQLSHESRDELGQDALGIIKDYLWVGSGAGSFYSTFPHYRANKVSGGFSQHAHNDYAEFLSEYGLLGFVPLALAVLLSLLTALRALYKRRNPLLRGAAFASTMGIFALLIHSTVDFNLQIPANAMMFSLLMALSWISLHLKSD